MNVSIHETPGQRRKFGAWAEHPAPTVQFRYAIYCVAHCLTPAQMILVDADRWPGGLMCGFILWIGARWWEWRQEYGFPGDVILGDGHHRDFDLWLTDRFCGP